MKKIAFLLALVMILSVAAGCAPNQPANNSVVPGNDVNSLPPANAAENTVPPANNTVVPGNDVNSLPPANSAENTVTPPANTAENTVTPPANTAENTVTPPANTAENTNTVPPGKDGKNVNTPPAAAVAFEEPYRSGIFTEDSLMQYLDGTWDLLPTGALPQYPDDEYIHLEVNAKEKTFLFTLAEDSTFIKLGLEATGSIFDFNESLDYIYMSVKEASQKYSSQAAAFIGSPAEFQVLTANADGFDLLAIRESGNGESGLAYHMLGMDKKSGNDFWVFRKQQTDSKIKLSDADNDKLLIKNGDFYALTWYCFSDRFNLQQIDVLEDFDTFVETPVAVLKVFYYYGNGMTLVAPSYKVAGSVVNKTPGQIRPMLVRVKTNDKGEITEMTGMEYIAYGEYENPYVNDHWYRSGYAYGKNDKVYLGDWKLANDSESTLKITAVTPEIGGYHLKFDLKGKGSMESDAYHMGNDLIAMPGHLKLGGKDIECSLTQGDFGTIVVNIAESASDQLPAGTKLVFKR